MADEEYYDWSANDDSSLDAFYGYDDAGNYFPDSSDAELSNAYMNDSGYYEPGGTAGTTEEEGYDWGGLGKKVWDGAVSLWNNEAFLTTAAGLFGLFGGDDEDPGGVKKAPAGGGGGGGRAPVHGGYGKAQVSALAITDDKGRTVGSK